MIPEPGVRPELLRVWRPSFPHVPGGKAFLPWKPDLCFHLSKTLGPSTPPLTSWHLVFRSSVGARADAPSEVLSHGTPHLLWSLFLEAELAPVSQLQSQCTRHHPILAPQGLPLCTEGYWAQETVEWGCLKHPFSSTSVQCPEATPGLSGGIFPSTNLPVDLPRVRSRAQLPPLGVINHAASPKLHVMGYPWRGPDFGGPTVFPLGRIPQTELSGTEPLGEKPKKGLPASLPGCGGVCVLGFTPSPGAHGGPRPQRAQQGLGHSSEGEATVSPHPPPQLL